MGERSGLLDVCVEFRQRSILFSIFNFAFNHFKRNGMDISHPKERMTAPSTQGKLEGYVIPCYFSVK